MFKEENEMSWEWTNFEGLLLKTAKFGERERKEVENSDEKTFVVVV